MSDLVDWRELHEDLIDNSSPAASSSPQFPAGVAPTVGGTPAGNCSTECPRFRGFRPVPCALFPVPPCAPLCIPCAIFPCESGNRSPIGLDLVQPSRTPWCQL